MRRELAIAASLIACGAPPSPAPLSSTVAAITCALPAPRRTPVELTFDRELGMVGGRNWIVAVRGYDYVLVALDDRGELAITELGANQDHGPSLQLALVGDELWVALIDDRDRETDYVLELTTAHPARRAVPLVGIGDNQVAMSASRILRHPNERVSARLELIDRRHGNAQLSSMIYTPLGVDSPWLRCIGDACFAITITYGDRGTLELASFRFAADGTTAYEVLDTSSIDADAFAAIADGDHTRIAWRSNTRGLLEVTLDATGHAIAPPVQRRATAPYHIAWLPTAPPTLAYNAGAGWITVGGRSLGLPSTSYLDAARTPDGTLVIGSTSEVTIDSPSTAGSKNVATFAGGPVFDLQFGVRHTSWLAVPLVAPRYVAALVLEQGHGPAAGELVLLREPCVRH